MPTPPRDQFLDLPEGDPLSTEHLDEKVQQAEQQEQVLKRQLETIEKQKREFADLSRRQEALITGRNDLADKLTRALVVIEREAMEASKRLEMLQTMDTSFHQHLDTLEAINPKLWDEAEYSRSFPRVGAMPEQTGGTSASDPGLTADYAGGDAKDFIGWLKIGFAFSLPLIVLGLIALVVIASRLSGK